MTQAKAGDTVKVHYTGTLDDGTIFDTSVESEPLEFTVGAGEVIPGFDEAIVDMQPGQSKTTRIPAHEAYGEYHPEMVLTVGRDQFPDHISPEIDQQLQLGNSEGQTFVVTITAVTDDKVTLDGNHPLAGKDLTFELQLIEIV